MNQQEFEQLEKERDNLQKRMDIIWNRHKKEIEDNYLIIELSDEPDYVEFLKLRNEKSIINHKIHQYYIQMGWINETKVSN
jgi:hypothetical protein